jgi:hypothetical protein
MVKESMKIAPLMAFRVAGRDMVGSSERGPPAVVSRVWIS